MDSLSFRHYSGIFSGMVLSLVLWSGFYNTYYAGFNFNSNKFDQARFSIKDFPVRNFDKVIKKEKVAYSKRHKRTFVNAVEVRNYDRVGRNEDVKPMKRSDGQGAFIQDDLSLELAEFYNAKHFKKVLKGNEVEGNLVMSNGTIDLLEVYLPDDKEIVSEFLQVNGNVFSYSHEGQTFSGMIYQSSKEYVVSLVNGPYQGTKMKFIKGDSGERSLSNDENIDDVYNEGREIDYNDSQYNELPEGEYSYSEDREFLDGRI